MKTPTLTLTISCFALALVLVGCGGPEVQEESGSQGGPTIAERGGEGESPEPGAGSPEGGAPEGGTPGEDAPSEGVPEVGPDGVRTLEAEPLMGPFDSAKAGCNAMADEMSKLSEEVDESLCELGESGFAAGPVRAAGKGPWLGAQTVILRSGNLGFLSLLVRTEAGWFGMPGISLATAGGDEIEATSLRFEVANAVGDEAGELVLEFQESERWEEEEDGVKASYKLSHTSQVLCGLNGEQQPSCLRIPLSWTNVIVKGGEAETSVTELTVLPTGEGTLQISGDITKLSAGGQEIAKEFLGENELVFP